MAAQWSVEDRRDAVAFYIMSHNGLPLKRPDKTDAGVWMSVSRDGMLIPDEYKKEPMNFMAPPIVQVRRNGETMWLYTGTMVTYWVAYNWKEPMTAITNDSTLLPKLKDRGFFATFSGVPNPAVVLH